MAAPGWQQRWLQNFVANMTPGEWPAEDLVNDGWTDLAKRMRGRILERSAGSVTAEQIMAEVEAADFEKMSEIRGRVDTIVADPDTAGATEGVVPPALQAALLPRRVPGRLQPPDRSSHRY